MIDYNMDTKIKTAYLEKLKTEKNKLNSKSKQFVEDFLFTNDEYYRVGSYWKNKINNELAGKNVWKLSDIFPKKTYPALDLIIGKKFRKNMLELCEKVLQYPYTYGWYRKMIRSTNYRHHFEKITNHFLPEFINMYMMNMDVMKILQASYDYNKVNFNFHELYALEIDKKNTEIINYIKESILSENNTHILTRDIINGIIASKNKELIELIGKLLIAAKLQEGLRQNICEAMDCGLQENFEYLFDIIYENNMIRFSSVKRAISTFTGIGEENSDRITKKEVEIIWGLNHNKIKAKELIKSDDNVECLLGLWKKGSEDITYLIDGMYYILEYGKRHSHLLISYVLNILQDKILQHQLSKHIIKVYACNDESFTNQNGLEVLACFNSHFLNDFGYYSFKEKIKEKSFKLENYFENEKDAELFFEILERGVNAMNKKEVRYSPCIFPWNYESLNKSDLAQKMGVITVLSNNKLNNRMLDYIKNIDYSQIDFIELLYSQPKSKKEKDMLISVLGSRNSKTHKVKDIIKKNHFSEEYIDELASLFRLKTPEIRQAVIELLYSLPTKKLESTLENLINKKDEKKRLGALDLLLKAKQDKKINNDKLKKIVSKIERPTSSEEVLIKEVLSKNLNENIADKLFNADYQAKIELNITHKIKTKDIFIKTPEEIYDLLKQLNDLYIENENYEYKTAYGVEELLGNRFSAIIQKKHYSDKDDIEQYPLKEIWLQFYNDKIVNFSTLQQLFEMCNYDDSYNKDELDFLYDELHANTSNNTDATDMSANKDSIKLYKMLGVELSALKKILKEKPLKYCGDSYRNNQAFEIIDVLHSTMLEEFKSELFDQAKAVFDSYLENTQLKDLAVLEKKRWNEKQYYSFTFENNMFLRRRKLYLDYYQNDEEFLQAFSLKFKLDQELSQLSKEKNFGYEKSYTSLSEIAYAVHLGLVKQDAFYQYVLSSGSENASNIVNGISGFIDGSLPDKRISDSTITSNNKQSISVIKKHGQKIIDYLINVELKRGDVPLTYSNSIHKIMRMEGIKNLIAVLNALGNLKLDRNTWYWSSGDSKQATLSHLLKVSYPLKDETASDLKKELKGSDISDQRLTEVAMYAPQWIPLLEEYLGWKGMASGCYYFQAHMSDIDRKKESLFAKYTPIAIDDLEIGAFDINWFKSAYDELGNEHFDMLYESAKYISDGSKHSRARKFADAVLGKFEITETEIEIETKRNKDLLASYGLIPLGKNKNADLLRRYKFLQKFLKDSKKFGAQRRASEAKAFNIALDNLARNAGYTNVTRLVWIMETDLITEMKHMFSPKAVGDIEAYIKIDETGHSSIVYNKSGKVLKSMPSKLKKDPYMIELKTAHKNLKDQYSRSKKMLEEAMEDATIFESAEIDNLLKNNPVISPLLKNLLMKYKDEIGYYKNASLNSLDGKVIKLNDNAELKIAHTLDLYNSKKWTLYQKDLFDREIKQVFKQVFREIYIKTDDELGKYDSRRYAGNQIQASKTIALLKTRRWVVDGEEGLQKVYYKENIIAKIYALADWFSPAEVEAPTLEWVQFYDRKTFKEIKIDMVPDLIFSEVMRDVDLVVSVAHVGGVDPETSHSTIEMRKAIVQFNLPLFKLDNVSFSEKHVLIKGELAEYSIHLGSGLVHQKAGAVINVLPVHSQHRGKLFLPFMDEDPKTAEIMTKIIFFAKDTKIKDPSILNQIKINTL